MSLLGKVVGTFGVSFQEDKFQVKEVTCDISVGKFEGKLYKTNPHPLE